MASPSTALRTLSLAVPLAGVAAIPDEAEACSIDSCFFVDAWSAIEPVNGAAIPIDGVLLLQGAGTGTMPDADWLTRIDLTVTRDGQPVAGALETSSIDDLLIWRPAAPLEPGATFKVTGTLDNPDMMEYYDCGPDILMIDFDFTSGMEPTEALAAPGVGAEESVLLNPSLSIDDLVCCDEAFPYEYFNDCGGSYGGTTWFTGFCAPLRGYGVLQVQLTVDHDMPESTSALVTRQVVTDGEPGAITLGDTLSASGGQPICTEVILRNLATGESVTTPKECHGDAVATQLGPQNIDPSGQLGEKCSSAAYVCERSEETASWDPEKCTPWPPEDPTTGDTAPTGGPETTGDSTGDTAPTGGPETAGDSTSADASAGDSSDSDASDTADTADQDGLGDRGCSCDGGAPDGLGLLALAGLGLLRRRRPTIR